MGGRRDPFEEIEELFEQLNAGFGEMSGEYASVGGTGMNVDVAETDDQIVVTADVPGFDADDIDVSVTDRQLRIDAEHSEETEEGEEDTEPHYYRRERSTRSVSRTVSLPTDVEEHEAAASYENGVLTVELPKATDEDGVDIEVS